MTMVALSLAVVACDKNDDPTITTDISGDWEQTGFETTEAGKALGWDEGDIDYWEMELFEDHTLRDNFFVVSEKQMERGYGLYYVDGDILVTTYNKGCVNSVEYGRELECQFFYRIESADENSMVLQFLGDNDAVHGDNNIADLKTAKATTKYLFKSIMKKRNDLVGEEDSIVGYWDYVPSDDDEGRYRECVYRSNGKYTAYGDSDGTMFRIEGTYEVDGDFLTLSASKIIRNGEITKYAPNEEVLYHRILKIDKDKLVDAFIGVGYDTDGVYPYIKDKETAKATTDYFFISNHERE